MSFFATFWFVEYVTFNVDNVLDVNFLYTSHKSWTKLIIDYIFNLVPRKKSEGEKS